MANEESWAEAFAAPTVRVMALHALLYCERLFYLEEVEEIRVADAAVYAGRTLHEELDEEGDVVDLSLESADLGLRGKLDAVRRRDGTWYPVEHKRGRAKKGDEGPPGVWPSDRVQVVAYAMLLEEHLGQTVSEARVRYHRDKVTVRLPILQGDRAEVLMAVERARALARSPERPPVAANERLCVRCSLAPVCLPEEARLAEAEATEPERSPAEAPTPVRLYPADTERRSLHVVTPGAKVGRSADMLMLSELEKKPVKVGLRELSDVVVHGHAQVTTQALRLCASEEVPVHYVTSSGAYLGSFAGPSGGVQRRIRQYRGLCDDALAFSLAKRLVMAKVEMQLRHVLRGSRKTPDLRAKVEPSIVSMRNALHRAVRSASREALMGEEGAAARAYFAALAELVVDEAGPEMRPRGRSRRPPEDRFNALLSFGYALLYKDVQSALLRVGLEPSFGVLHRPRSAAFPLVLDLAELFRVPLVDLAVMGAVNRRSFDPNEDFTISAKQVWLSEAGRRKLIDVYERRKHEEYKHERLGYTLSYARLIELEARLLEKEWSGEPGLFATFRIR
jgi:CRISP-associated protein Cas1